MFPDDIEALARAVIKAARARGWRLATAESCTGGLVAGAITAVAGSSEVLEGGFVTYSNVAKASLLGVDAGLVARHGAVSEPVALAMAEGAARALGADLTVAITGVAGPSGGTAEKPVGLVHFATAGKDLGAQPHLERYGDLGREQVRLASVRTALQLLLARLSEPAP